MRRFGDDIYQVLLAVSNGRSIMVEATGICTQTTIFDYERTFYF